MEVIDRTLGDMCTEKEFLEVILMLYSGGVPQQLLPAVKRDANLENAVEVDAENFQLLLDINKEKFA